MYGVSDNFFGEEVAAAVRLKPDQEVAPEDLRRFVREHLARFKAPRYIEFVEAFPQTASGKIQKFRLKEQWVPRWGVAQASACAARSS